jgi:glycosyltransferase involved in cell wall biosynthesis
MPPSRPRRTAAAAGSEPEICVIVPAHGAAATLGRTLDALARSTFDGTWEVVVVDDASPDATADIAERAGVRVVRLPTQSGPAAARNAGTDASEAPLIAFTDADCEPTAGWLGALVRALGDADLVTGPVIPDPQAPRGPYDRTLQILGPTFLFETANLAVRRAVVEQVGGFRAFAPAPGAPPGLRPRPEEGHFGEDVVFGWEAQRAGARVGFAPEAIVHHAVFPRDARGYIAERWRLRFFPALVREIPELRPRVHLRIFLGRRTARFDLAVAALGGALVGRRPIVLLATLPYACSVLGPNMARRRSAARHVAVLVLADLVGCLALVRGSLAARRVLL